MSFDFRDYPQEACVVNFHADEIKREIEANITAFDMLREHQVEVRMTDTSPECPNGYVNVIFRKPNDPVGLFLYAKPQEAWSSRDYAFMFLGLGQGIMFERKQRGPGLDFLPDSTYMEAIQ